MISCSIYFYFYVGACYTCGIDLSAVLNPICDKLELREFNLIHGQGKHLFPFEDQVRRGVRH